MDNNTRDTLILATIMFVSLTLSAPLWATAMDSSIGLGIYRDPKFWILVTIVVVAGAGLNWVLDS